MKKKIQKAASLLLAAAVAFAAWDMPVAAEGARGQSPANPVHHCTNLDDGSDRTDWSYVYFGRYPQTEVTPDMMNRDIADAFYDINGDAWVNGTRYRRISKDDTNYDEYFGRSPFRYFKWEPIKWRVLENNGSELFLMADEALDCMKLNRDSCPITWEGCSLRRWLNGGFYQEAFHEGERAAIVGKSFADEESSDSGKVDNISLLCFLEAINPEYGFCQDRDTMSASRGVAPSAYAHAMGAYLDDGVGNSAGKGNCHWWMRWPGNNPQQYAITSSDGSADWRSGNFYARYIGIVPVLHIKLSSDSWSFSNNGNGGSGAGGSSGTGGSGSSSTSTGAGSGSSGSAGTGAGNSAGGTGSGSGSGSVTKVKPSATAISGKVKAKSKGFTVKWKKKKGVSGYQIQYSTSKKFTKKTTKMKTVKKATATSLTVKKLKAKKTYYVRVRTYQTAGGKETVSKWSKVKTVTTKR